MPGSSNRGHWLAVARAASSLFLLLVGLSLTLSHSRARMLGQEEGYFSCLLKRSAWIFELGLGVTIVTYLAGAGPDGFLFG